MVHQNLGGAKGTHKRPQKQSRSKGVHAVELPGTEEEKKAFKFMVYDTAENTAVSQRREREVNDDDRVECEVS